MNIENILDSNLFEYGTIEDDGFTADFVDMTVQQMPDFEDTDTDFYKFETEKLSEEIQEYLKPGCLTRKLIHSIKKEKENIDKHIEVVKKAIKTEKSTLKKWLEHVLWLFNNGFDMYKYTYTPYTEYPDGRPTEYRKARVLCIKNDAVFSFHRWDEKTAMDNYGIEQLCNVGVYNLRGVSIHYEHLNIDFDTSLEAVFNFSLKHLKFIR